MNGMGRRLVKAVLALLPLASVGCGQEEAGSRDAAQEPDGGVKLQLRMKKGDSYWFGRTDCAFLEEGGLMGSRIDLKMEVEYALTCLEVDADGAMMIEQYWDKAKIKGDGLTGRVDWDSEKPQRIPKEMLLYSKLKKKSVEVLVRPNGEMVDLWKGEVIADAILSQKGIKPGPKMPQEDYDVIQEGVIEDVRRNGENLLDGLLTTYSDHPLTAGQTWLGFERNYATRSGKAQMEFTLTEVKDGMAYCDVKATEWAGRDPLDSRSGLLVDTSWQAAGKGKARIDVTSGLITWAKITANVSMEGSSYIIGLEDFGKETKMTGKLTTILEIVPE